MDFNPERNWREIDDKGFNTHIGPILFTRLDQTTWQGALKLAPQHINMGGVCHGGVYMSLADVTMGASAHSAAEQQRCATIDFQAHFLAAAKLDQWLVAEARLNRLVSGLVFMECELWAGGRHCMRANGIWKLLNLPPRT